MFEVSDGDTISILHMHDGMVCHHPIKKKPVVNIYRHDCRKAANCQY